MNHSKLTIAASVGLFLAANLCPADDAPQPPASADGSVKVSLLANAPQVVTPIGASVDAQGHLLVIESNTHFRPKDYQGPVGDRLLMVTDPGDGKLATDIKTIYEAGPYMMNVVAQNGSIVVSQRNDIFRLVLSDSKDAPPTKISIAHLQTQADYPHNGLHGLAIAKNGDIYFGLGENFGGAYTLTGTDGQKISDDKGSGAVFRVDSQGRGITRICHGFWNPFGLGFDSSENLFLIDNDPDGRPPCRLIHVVPGADFGFEWRYGRTGLHPLQGWDGELPGTLGMVAGVGEAPVAVVWHGDRLFVSSWRDHQIQMFKPVPHGASYTATMEPLVTGPESFRPTGMAFAPDGSLYVNDWGSASYSVNRKGCIWKLTFPKPLTTDEVPKPNEAMTRAEHLRQSSDIAELTKALDDTDPSIAQAAEYGLSRQESAEKIDYNSLTTPTQRIGLIAALVERGTDVSALATAAIKDPNDRVRQMGVRAISEQNIKSTRAGLDELLNSQVLSPRLLGMTIAVINQLDGDKSAKVDPKKTNGILLARLNSLQATDDTKATSLHMLQISPPIVPLDALRDMTHSPLQALQLEAIRYLPKIAEPARFDVLANVAGDAKASPAVRAEALVGLSDNAAVFIDILLRSAHSEDATIRNEALRSLKPAVSNLTDANKSQLGQIAKQFPADADLVHRVLGEPLTNRPPETDIPTWQKILDQAPGDPDAGRRIFFHPAGAGCYKCHMVEGRGHAIGPDLTMIGHSQTRDHVLESILDPSKEIAPLFTLWSIKTKSGKQIDGMLLRRDGQEHEVWVDSSGQETTVDEHDVIERRMRKESLMPTGLVQALTDQELRDLVAFLMEKR